jgi:7,8-dihydropterin-6-yl-methyl-4-(beta-D-ribofuranosyl)aminobenzene 5'-phosphate synthase
VIIKEATLTILADNRAEPPFSAEHGFSVLVSAVSAGGEELVVLFDTGRGRLIGNAALSLEGASLPSARYLVLSHGHYDHTDALAEVLSLVPELAVCASRKVTMRHYSTSTGLVRDRSLSPRTRGILGRLPPERRIFFDDGLSLFPAGKAAEESGGEDLCAAGPARDVPRGLVNLAGNIPREHRTETPARFLFSDRLCTAPDSVPDEIVLWMESSAGLIILTGCCHAGFINTCEHIKRISGITSIYAVVGGFHLALCGAERLEEICAYVRLEQIRRLIPCHCTGEEESWYLEEQLGGGIVESGRVGKIVIF